ncbi:hypothetical protein LguiB_036358 [Lonicera macranthoides]
MATTTTTPHRHGIIHQLLGEAIHLSLSLTPFEFCSVTATSISDISSHHNLPLIIGGDGGLSEEEAMGSRSLEEMERRKGKKKFRRKKKRGKIRCLSPVTSKNLGLQLSIKLKKILL